MWLRTESERSIDYVIFFHATSTAPKASPAYIPSNLLLSPVEGSHWKRHKIFFIVFLHRVIFGYFLCTLFNTASAALPADYTVPGDMGSNPGLLRLWR